MPPKTSKYECLITKILLVCGFFWCGICVFDYFSLALIYHALMLRKSIARKENIIVVVIVVVLKKSKTSHQTNENEVGVK